MRGLLLCTASATLCLVGTCAASAQSGEPITAIVNYTDLNLSTVSGRTAFKGRVHRLASQTCVSAAEGFYNILDRSRCMRAMEMDGDTQLAAIAARVSVRFASLKRSEH